LFVQVSSSLPLGAIKAGRIYRGRPGTMYIVRRAMYNRRMTRTQIYLGTEDLDLLDRAARATGATRSELIRRAIRARYRFEDRKDLSEEARAALREVAGIWKDRPFTTEEYIRAIRRGERLPDE
jgi:hypothetical protein